MTGLECVDDPIGSGRIPEILTDLPSYFLSFVFGKTNSYCYELAVATAKRADRYIEVGSGKGLLHFAGFKEITEDVFLLARYIEGWKASDLHIRGRHQGIYGAMQTLNCHAVAARCDNWKAHCHQVVDDYRGPGRLMPPSGVIYDDPEQYIFPCRLLLPYFRFEKKLDATPQEQIQAAAAERGCDWCPNFDANGYVKTSSHE